MPEQQPLHLATMAGAGQAWLPLPLLLLLLLGSGWAGAVGGLAAGSKAPGAEHQTSAGDARDGPHTHFARPSGQSGGFPGVSTPNVAMSTASGRAQVWGAPHQQQGVAQSSGASPASRHLSQIGSVYADLPAGDLLGLDSILAAAREALAYLDPSLSTQSAAQPRPYAAPRSRSALGASSSRELRGPDSLALVVSFQSTHPDEDTDTAPRLPAPPRSFNMTVEPLGGGQACVHNRLPYTEGLEVLCQGMPAGSQWVATLVDADSDDLILASTNFTVGGTGSQEVLVQLGMLGVEASFDQLAWAGMYYPRPRQSTSTIIIHAIIVGAQVVVYTRQGGKEVVWDVQWTGSEGTTAFFLVPGARGVFWANMTVGETVLRSAPLTLESPLSVYQDANDFEAQTVPQLQEQQLTAVPQLLCTGEVEDVRGNAGTFPQSLAPLQAKQQSIFHPKGFTCRWQLTPEQPDVLLSVDYRGLLPDESITLELAPNNVIRLVAPQDGSPGAVFQASVWVEDSILVSFRTTRLSTDKVGAFSISWTSVASSKNGGMLDGKTMVVVLSCVSAAGALLAACCFYFVCCGRRRRAGGVVVDSEQQNGGVQLLRVPSAVRELLPSKPYQAPEVNPLPGAETEPDCCSICLVELEAGEQVTVLPCMHFYHKECIGSWLKRNCTCPLCKNNVLEAFKVQQYEARQARRNQRRGLTAPALAAATAAAAASSNGSSSPSSSSSRAAEAAAQDIQQQQFVEMTTLHPLGPSAAAASPVPGWAGSRSESPWLPVDGGGLRAPSPAAAALPGQADSSSGEGVVALTVLPARTAVGRLPPLQHPQQQQQPGGSWLRSLTPAAVAANAPPLVIPPSPSPSMLSLSLQSGSVLATPEDFAPAAAAAAAHLAETASSRPRSTSPTAGLADAAQASVAALRTSSRNLGRRLHVLLSPTSAAAPAAAGTSVGATPDASGSHAAAGGSVRRGNSPLPPLPPVPGSFVVTPPGIPRVAVSIYACDPSLLQQQGAGGSSGEHQAIAMPTNLPGSVDGSGQGERPHQQQREQQQH